MFPVVHYDNHNHIPKVIVLKYVHTTRDEEEQLTDQDKLIHIASSIEAAKIQAYVLMIDSKEPWRRKVPHAHFHSAEYPYRRYAEWIMKKKDEYKYLSIEQIPVDQAIKAWRFIFSGL